MGVLLKRGYLMENIRARIYRDKSFYLSFFRIAVVLAGQNLLSNSVNLVDNMMLGQYNQAALSGNALSDQIQFFFFMVVGAFAEGVVVIGAQYWGQKRSRPIESITAIALRVSVIFCTCMFLLCLLFPQQVIGLMTDDAAVRAEGARVLRLVSFSFVFAGVSATLMASLRCSETVHVGLIISASTLVISIVFNYVLIFGRFGFPALGVLGAGIATIATRVVELGIVLTYVLKKDKKLNMKLKRLVFAWDNPLWKDYRKVTIPIVCSSGMWGAAAVIQSAILGHLDADVIAANAIAVVVFQLTAVLPYGTATSASILTGKAVGEGNLEIVKKMAFTMQLLFLGIGVLSGLTLFGVSNFVLLAYPNITAGAAALAKQFLTVFSVILVGTSYQMPCLTGIVRGGGDTKFVFRNDTVFIWCVVIPSSMLSAYVLGLPPVVTFACLKCDQILKCFVAVIKVNSFNWVRRLTRPAAETPAPATCPE